MNTEFDDDAMIDELRSGFDGVTYPRAVHSLRPRSRTPFIAGAVALSAVVATVVVVGGDGARSPALAWSPTPSLATASDEAAVRAACQTGGAPSVEAKPITVTGFATGSAAAGSAPVGDGPSGTIVGVGASGTVLGGVDLPDGKLPVPPQTLPPLVSLDLRGNGGLAVFADATWTMSCIVVKTSSGFAAGPLMAAPTDLRQTDGSFAVTSGSGTTWSDGRSLAMVSGTAPKGATTVRLTVPGQEPATAAVVDGRFSIWWIGAFEPSKSTLTALDGSNATVGTLSPMLPEPPLTPAAP